MRSTWSRRLAWLLLLAAFVPVVLRAGGWIQENWPSRRNPMLFFDFRVHTNEVDKLEDKGILFDTQLPDYFSPSSAVYKYPPTFAAVLRTTNDLPLRAAMRIALVASGVLLLATLATLLLHFRAGAMRAALMTLLFLGWLPFYESLAGLQLEPIMLLLLAIGLLAVRGGRPFLAGVMVGAATAWKVYPIALLGYFALRRQWRAWAGALVGFGGTVALTFIAIHPRYWLQWFTEILPKVGGATLWYSNISLFGALGRLSVWLTAGRERVEEFGAVSRPLIDETGIGAVPILTLALTGIMAAALLWASLQAFRRSPRPAGERDGLAFGMAICLALLLLPTSWADYQTFLFLTLAALLAAAPAPPRAPLLWLSTLAAVLLATLLDGNGSFYVEHFALGSLLRMMVPLLLWLAAQLCLRTPPASQAPPASSAPLAPPVPLAAGVGGP